MVGTIMKGIGGFYYVKASDSIYECKARGIFRKEKITPMIGDKVKIETDGEKGSIIEIMPRKSSLIRPPVANVDTMMLVVAAASPEPNLFLIDKMLINAEINNITPVICINKTDIKKRPCVRHKTQGRFLLNASAFYLKRKGVLNETNLRFFERERAAVRCTGNHLNNYFNT